MKRSLRQQFKRFLRMPFSPPLISNILMFATDRSPQPPLLRGAKGGSSVAVFLGFHINPPFACWGDFNLALIVQNGIRVGKRLFLLLIPLLLTGCVNYEVGINIAGLHRGEIVQHIQLGKQLTSFSQADVEDWLGSLEKRTRQLGGKTKRLSPAEVELTIPFANAEQLEAKFNRFFNPKGGNQPPSELVQLKSQLKTDQNNFLLLQRTHLEFDLDLSALGTIKGQSSRLIGANSLLDLEFQLQTPLGLKIIRSNPEQGVIKQTAKSAVWYLQPGKNNEIEVVFWGIEPLGWGAIAIMIIVYIGFWLKYRRSSYVEDTMTQN